MQINQKLAVQNCMHTLINKKASQLNLSIKQLNHWLSFYDVLISIIEEEMMNSG